VTRLRGIRLAFAALGMLCAGLVVACTPAARKPNILVIVIDDLGWADLGAYGRTRWDTPHIDRLAGEGMRFTNAYAAGPTCSPTRASIMTGRHPARLGITDWIPGASERYENPRVITPDWQRHLPLSEITIAEVLHDAGYRTACIGKWHLGDAAYFPQHQGFDDVFMVSATNVEDYFGYRDDGSRDRAATRENQKPEHLTELLTRKAEAWLDSHGRSPFFLYFATHVVHTPLQAREAIVEKYTARGLPEKGSESATYAAMVDHSDEAVGRLLAKLDQIGIAEDTVVIFVSDNGGRVPQTSNSPLRGGKGELLEGGIRVPLIVRWPGVVRPGSVRDSLVITTDFFPTLLEVAGLPVPRDQDGVSLLPDLRGEEVDPDRALYWHYPHYSGRPYGVPSSALRKGDWKLIEFLDDGRAELYDLAHDIGERLDRAQDQPGRVESMRDQLRRWREEVAAQMPVPNPAYVEDAPSGMPRKARTPHPPIARPAPR